MAAYSVFLLGEPHGQRNLRATDQRVTKNHTTEHRQISLRLTNISLLCFVFNMVINHGRYCQVAVRVGILQTSCLSVDSTCISCVTLSKSPNLCRL